MRRVTLLDLECAAEQYELSVRGTEVLWREQVVLYSNSMILDLPRGYLLALAALLLGATDDVLALPPVIRGLLVAARADSVNRRLQYQASVLRASPRRAREFSAVK